MQAKPAHLALEVRPRNKLENRTEQAAKSVTLSLSVVGRNELVIAPAYTGRLSVSPANLDDSDLNRMCETVDSFIVRPILQAGQLRSSSHAFNLIR